MESILPFVAVAALALACPLGMAAIGGAAWLVARARGEKKDFSAGCMSGHGEPPSASSTGTSESPASNIRTTH